MRGRGINKKCCRVERKIYKDIMKDVEREREK